MVDNSNAPPDESADRYWKLRPAGPTPDVEMCRCASVGALSLRDSFGKNPLFCLVCNAEIAPERIGFDAQLAEDIAFWLNIRHALKMLWLDSGEYEQWAARRLGDPNGSVNVKGRRISKRLNQKVRTYYWWFSDFSVDGYEPPNRCPLCGGDVVQTARECVVVCDACSIAMQQ